MKQPLLFAAVIIFAMASLGLARQEISIEAHCNKDVLFVTLDPKEELVVSITKERASWHNGIAMNDHSFSINPEFRDANYFFPWDESHHLDFNPSLSTDTNPMTYHFIATNPGKTRLCFSKAISYRVYYLSPVIGVTVREEN